VTLSEIREEVRLRLQELTGVEVWWTDEEIDEAIADAEDEMADATEWYEAYQTVDILKNRPYYDLRTVIRRDFLVAGPAFNDTTNRWLIPVRPHELDVSDRRWEERDYEPEFFMVRGLWWVSYWPWKDSEIGSVKQYYRGIPDHMSDDDDEPGFHRTFHMGIVEYAVCDLLSQDNETDLTLLVWRQYKEYEDGLAVYMKGRNQVPQMYGFSSEGGKQ